MPPHQPSQITNWYRWQTTSRQYQPYNPLQKTPKPMAKLIYRNKLVPKYPRQKNCKFLKFDIVDFYPSITEKLLSATISFAKLFTQIDDDAIQIIEHSRKSLLFNEKEAWIKNSDSLFDVTMGSFDGAEICELVGLFILNKLSNIIPIKDLGLYRDDGLAVLRNKSGPEMERTRKNIIKAFKEIELNITAETNLFQTDFLDVTFNLKSNKFFPYCKPDDHPLYINNQSNHPPSIRK